MSTYIPLKNCIQTAQLLLSNTTWCIFLSGYSSKLLHKIIIMILTSTTIVQYRCGPLTRYWCMRFEAKNSHFKNLARQINNFKNICKSLAKRHQAWNCYKFGGSNRILKGTVVGPGTYKLHSVNCTIIIIKVTNYLQ